MSTYTFPIKSDNQIIIKSGTEPFIIYRKVEGTTHKPGLLVKPGSTAYEVVLAGAGDDPYGVLLEQLDDDVMPGDTFDDDGKCRVLIGGDVFVKLRLASGQNASMGDLLVCAANGTVAVASAMSVSTTGIAAELDVAADSTPVTSTAANGAIITGGDAVAIAGSLPADGRIVGRAFEAVDASGGEAWIAVKKLW